MNTGFTIAALLVCLRQQIRNRRDAEFFAVAFNPRHPAVLEYSHTPAFVAVCVFLGWALHF